MAKEIMSASGIVERYESLWADDAQFRNLWQEILDFVMPRKSEVITKRGKGAKRTSVLLYDSTAGDSAITLASFIHGSVTSPTSQWIDLDFSDDELNADDESRQWLNNATKKFTKRIQQSNFDAEIQEVYAELVTVATGSIFTDAALVPATKSNPNGFGGFRFKSIPIGSYVISENPYGLVDTLMRQVDMSFRAAEEKFGAKALPDKIRNGKPDEEARILHAVFPRSGAPERAPMGTHPKKLPFASFWIDMDSKTTIQEGGFHEFPYAVCRWSKQSPEVWGRGQGEVALPDIRTLNEGVKLRLQGWGTAVRPPMEAKDKGITGRVSTKPSAVNWVKEMGNLKPINLGTQFDVANFNEKDLRAAIQRMFFIDKLQLPDKSIITATEAHARIAAANRILGPTLGRMDYELLRRIVHRGFMLMLRAGEFNPIPAKLLAVAQGDPVNIEVTFYGPLARAQKASELEAMSQFIGSVGPLASANPTVLDKINFDQFVDLAAEATNMTRLLQSAKAVKEIRTARAQAQSEQARQMQMLELMKVMGQASPALREAREAAAGRAGV